MFSVAAKPSWFHADFLSQPGIRNSDAKGKCRFFNEVVSAASLLWNFSSKEFAGHSRLRCSQRFRGYCLEMICAGSLARAQLEGSMKPTQQRRPSLRPDAEFYRTLEHIQEVERDNWRRQQLWNFRLLLVHDIRSRSCHALTGEKTGKMSRGPFRFLKSDDTPAVQGSDLRRLFAICTSIRFSHPTNPAHCCEIDRLIVSRIPTYVKISSPYTYPLF